MPATALRGKKETEEKASCGTQSECMSIIRPVRDALDILNGKWKLPIIICLSFGSKRFREISREIPEITDRMLAKELRDLEVNLLIKRTVYDSRPVVIEYTMTPYGKTLKRVINALKEWGENHRKEIFSKG